MGYPTYPDGLSKGFCLLKKCGAKKRHGLSKKTGYPTHGQSKHLKYSFSVSRWISLLCTSDSPSVFEAETNKIYVRSAPVLEIWKEEIKMEEIISALKVVRKYSKKTIKILII